MKKILHFLLSLVALLMALTPMLGGLVWGIAAIILQKPKLYGFVLLYVIVGVLTIEQTDLALSVWIINFLHLLLTLIIFYPRKKSSTKTSNSADEKIKESELTCLAKALNNKYVEDSKWKKLTH